jgi:SAM-dependent methyltransferase
MWLQMYRAARAVLHHPGQFTQQPISQLVRNLLLNLNLLSDRVYMRKSVLPLLASTGIKRVLFVGCKPYTAGYGKRLSRISIDYWTTDIDPQAAMWGEKDHHIISDIIHIDAACSPASFDAVLLNGVFGHGVNERSEMNCAIEAIARILRPNGILLIGWNSGLIQDPIGLAAINRYFRRDAALPLPLRKTFPDTDHVYDWLVKVDTCGASRPSQNSDFLSKSQ